MQLNSLNLPDVHAKKSKSNHQFENPKEVDGRVIDSLLFDLRLPRLRIPFETPVVLSKADRDRLISTWRRCLAAPYNTGTVLAMEELIALRDLESLPLLQRVVSELQSGCAPNRDEASIPETEFPWLTQYNVDYLEGKISELAAPAENP